MTPNILCACGCGRICHPRPGKIASNKTGRYFFERACQSKYNRENHTGKGQKQNKGYGTPAAADRVLNAMPYGVHLSTEEIALLAGFSSGYTYRVLRDLEKKGNIEKIFDEHFGCGYWARPSREKPHKGNEEENK